MSEKENTNNNTPAPFVPKTTRVQLMPTGSPVAGLNVEPKHVKSYADPTPPATESVSTEKVAEGKVEEHKSESAPVKTEEKELSPEERRAQRRETFKEADSAYRRGIEMQKEAAEKLKKAEAILAAAQKMDEDPVAVIKAMGKDPGEFLRKYQNAIFNIKDEEAAQPEDPVKSQAEAYKKEIEAERQKLAQERYEVNRMNYTNKEILPELINNKDKYELLAGEDPQTSALFVYDLMNKHFRETGETLNVSEVAEELERQLQERAEQHLAKQMKVKKFSKFFKTEEPEKEAPKEEQLTTSTPKSKTLSDNLSSAPVPPRPKTPVYANEHEAKVRRVLEKFNLR